MLDNGIKPRWRMIDSGAPSVDERGMDWQIAPPLYNNPLVPRERTRVINITYRAFTRENFR